MESDYKPLEATESLPTSSNKPLEANEPLHNSSFNPLIQKESYGTFNKHNASVPPVNVPQTGSSEVPASEIDLSSPQEADIESEGMLDTLSGYSKAYAGETWFNIAIISLTVILSYTLIWFRLGLVFSLFIAYFIAKFYEYSVKAAYSRKFQSIQEKISIPELENDIESARWINQFMAQFWLQYEPPLSQSIVSGVEASFEGLLPTFIPSVRFTTFTLGNKPPLIEGIKYYKREESDLVIMDWLVSFTPHSHHEGILQLNSSSSAQKIDPTVILGIKIQVGPLNFNVPVKAANFSLKALVRVKLRLMNPYPHIKAIDVSLLDLPDVDFMFKPVDSSWSWDLMNLPGMKALVKRQMSLVLGSMILAPKVYTLDVETMMGGASEIEAAVGVLKLTLSNARNLKNVELLGVIDPFVSINVEGRKQLARTKTKDNTTEPVWDETFNLLLYNLNETLNMVIKDENGARKDVSLGVVPFDLSTLVAEPTQEHCTKIMKNAKQRGDLTYKLSYFPVAEPIKLDDGTEESFESNSGIVALFLRQIQGFEQQRKLIKLAGKTKVWMEIRLNGSKATDTIEMKPSNNIVFEDRSEHFVENCSMTNLHILLHSSESRNIAHLHVNLKTLIDSADSWHDLILNNPTGTIENLRIKLDAKWSPILLDADSHGALSPPIGFARVEVKKCKELKGTAEVVGKASGPNVIIVMSNVIKGRTQQAEPALEPIWDEVFYIPIHRANEVLRFEVKGKSLQKGKDLGSVEIKASDFLGPAHLTKAGFLDGEKKEKWYPLTLKKEKTKGSILLGIEYLSVIDKMLPDISSQRGTQHSRTTSTLPAQNSGHSAVSITDKPKSADPTDISETGFTNTLDKDSKCMEEALDLSQFNSGVLQVTALGGRGIGSARTKLYAKAIINGDTYNSILNTRIEKSKTNPSWGDSGEIFIKEVNVDTFTLQVYDSSNDSKGQLVGKFDIKVKNIVKALDEKLSKVSAHPNENEEPEWYNLDKGVGAVQVDFKFIPAAYVIGEVESSRNKGYLQVKVIRAEGLLAADKDGSSDPYVTLSINGVRKEKTKTKKNSLNPVYNESFNVEIPDRINSTLGVEVFDWNQIQQHSTLGAFTVDLKSLVVETTSSGTFPLTIGSNAKGTVTLELLFVPKYIIHETQPSLLDALESGNPVDLAAGLANGGLKVASGGLNLAKDTGKLALGGVKLAGEGAKTVLSAPLKLASSGAGLAHKLFSGKKDKDRNVSVDLNAEQPMIPAINTVRRGSNASLNSINSVATEDMHYPSNASGFGNASLFITLIEAKELPAADRNGYSDPYVKVYEGDKLVFKTKVKKKTRNPRWDESFIVPNLSLSGPVKLKFHVKDHNLLGENVVLGDYHLDLSEHFSDLNSPGQRTAEVWTAPGKLLEGGEGQLHFTLELNVFAFTSASQGSALPTSLQERTISASSTESFNSKENPPNVLPNTNSLTVPGAHLSYDSDASENFNDPSASPINHLSKSNTKSKSGFFGSLRKKISKN